MKTIAAALVLLVMFLFTDSSFADCTKDFWGNCEGTKRYRYDDEETNRYRHHDYNNLHCARDFWGRCSYGWRYRRHFQRPSYQGGGDTERGVICHTRRRVVGEERSSKEKALKAAESAWMGAVRYDFGERYQDLNHAKDVRNNCDPSSVTRLVKTPYFRCAVEATPCRAPNGSTDVRVERRYEVESED
jgi:hypothetical protein